MWPGGRFAKTPPGLLSILAIMPRPDVVRLREDPYAAPADAPVIEANFRVVAGHSFLGRIWRFSLALAAAALVGALLPLGWLMAKGVLTAFGTS